MPTNDNDDAMQSPATRSDAHGAAALLLVESLIHGLCEKATLNTVEAIEIVERAASVQSDHAEQADGEAALSWRSHALLQSIAGSLKIDVKDDLPHPA